MIGVDDFSAVLKRKMGLDSGSIGSAAIERAVRHRMQAVDSDDEQEYLARLQASPAEMQQLIEAVIVPETCSSAIRSRRRRWRRWRASACSRRAPRRACCGC